MNAHIAVGWRPDCPGKSVLVAYLSEISHGNSRFLASLGNKEVVSFYHFVSMEGCPKQVLCGQAGSTPLG